MYRSSGPNDETSWPKTAGTEPYVRSPTALTLPYSSLDDASV